MNLVRNLAIATVLLSSLTFAQTHVKEAKMGPFVKDDKAHVGLEVTCDGSKVWGLHTVKGDLDNFETGEIFKYKFRLWVKKGEDWEHIITLDPLDAGSLTRTFKSKSGRGTYLIEALYEDKGLFSPMFKIASAELQAAYVVWMFPYDEGVKLTTNIEPSKNYHKIID